MQFQTPAILRQAALARRRKVIGAVALAVLPPLLVTPALADLRMEGRFQGRGEGKLTLQVFAIDLSEPKAGYLVMAETAIPNACSGDVRGIARRIDEATLRLTRKPDDAEESCEVTLRFNPDRSRVHVTAKDCSAFHGASCEFTGSLRRR